MDSAVNPAHYTQGEIPCIDAMISAFGPEQVELFCRINAFKYIWRSTDHVAVLVPISAVQGGVP